MTYSICAGIFYTDLPLHERIDKIADEGFTTTEFWMWSGEDLDAIRETLDRRGLQLSCICLEPTDPVDRPTIKRYMLNSGNHAALVKAAKESIAVAQKVGAKALIVTVGDRLPDISDEEQIATAAQALKLLAPLFEECGLTLLVEPIHLKERPNYLLPNAKDVAKLVAGAGSPKVKMLYDIFHQAMEQDFDPAEMVEILPLIGHFHIADAPGRHEPGTGTVDYAATFKALQEAGYAGTVGVELIPTKPEHEVFEQLRALGAPYGLA